MQPHLLPIGPSGSVSGSDGYVVGLHAYLIVTRWPRVRRRLCWRPRVWICWNIGVRHRWRSRSRVRCRNRGRGIRRVSGWGGSGSIRGRARGLRSILCRCGSVEARSRGGVLVVGRCRIARGIDGIGWRRCNGGRSKRHYERLRLVRENGGWGIVLL